MPKKKPGMTPDEQRKKFQDEVARRIADGELDPIDAEKILDKLVRRSAVR